MNPTTFSIIGDGAMGTVCALLLAASEDRSVRLWCRNPDRAKRLADSRRNDLYLPNAAIPASVEITADFDAVADADVFVAATPLVYLRATLEPIKGRWPKGSFIVHVMKDRKSVV